MAEILLTVEEATSHAKDVTRTSADVQSQLTNLRNRLGSLNASFKGRTQVAWETRHRDMDQKMNAMLDALTDLGKFLEGAARQIQQADQDLASQLGS